jgi:hypothetical protein
LICARLTGKVGVGVVVLGDECSGKREDLVEQKRSVEWRWERRQLLWALGVADVRGVAGLDGEDRAGSLRYVSERS